MFNEITQTCNGADATWEILTMLAGAFLLGCLLCWLIRTLRSSDSGPAGSNRPPDGPSSKNYGLKEQSSSDTYAPHATQSAAHPVANVGKHQTYTGKNAHVVPQSAYSTPRIDDLTKISSIDKKVESLLKEKGVKSYIDLKDVRQEKLADVMKSPGFNVPRYEVETWPHQASLAAKGDWKKLSEYQAFKDRLHNASATPEPAHSTADQLQKDPLTKISGISPNIEKILNKNGITRYEQLKHCKYSTLKTYLADEQIPLNNLDFDSWPHQAELAEQGKWNELEEYLDFLNIKDSDSLENQGNLDLEMPTPVKNELNETRQPIASTRAGQGPNDDLKMIEGIGPKIEDVLNNKGITTFKQLHETNRNTLKAYLDEAGPRFKLHEPESWPHQAAMAYRGEWEKLKEYQDFMIGGRDNTVSFSGAASRQVKKAAETDNKDPSSVYVDDLTKIEGIGPKIEQLLNEAGVLNFSQLKSMDRDLIKDILDKGGPRFKIHEPESWPKQASLADKGEWKKLEEYQDVLIGGR